MKKISGILILLFLGVVFLIGCSCEKHYTITWKNYDGTVLKVDEEVQIGTIPVYTGETPTKEMDDHYSYVFSGWSPEVKLATQDAIYTAQFDSFLNEYSICFIVDGLVHDVLYFTMETQVLAPPQIPEKEGYIGVWEEFDLEVYQNQEVHAIYTANKYKVKFVDYYGIVQEEMLDFGSPITIPTQIPESYFDSINNRTKVFLDWGEVDETVPSHDVTYEAQYKDIEQYQVIFRNHDNSIFKEVAVDKNNKVICPLEEPIKEGYSFVKWMNGDEEYDFDLEVTENLDLKPEFTLNTYKLTFKIDEEVVGIVDFNVEMNSIIEPEIQPKEGYNGEWSQYNLQLAQNQEVQAVYTPKAYTITWKNWDDTILKTDTNALYDSVPQYDGPIPTKTGYTFSGWDPEISVVKGDKTYTATFSLTTYKLIFKFGVSVIGIIDFNIEMESIVEPAVPLKEGYIGAWDTYNLQLAQNQEVQAIYTPKTYTVTWKNWNGDILETDLNVPYDTMLEYNGPTPTKYGYDFTGWNPTVQKVTNDIEYVAQFIIATYTITFKVGESIIDTVDFNIEMESITEPVAPLKTGYTGVWGTYDLSLAQNQEVQAIYTLITYTIIFKVGDLVIDIVDFNIEMEAIIEPALSEKTGYDGVWGTYNLSLAQNQVVQAIYTLKTYIITFKVLEEVIDTVDFNIEMESITEPAVPLKEGYDGAWGTYNLQLAQNQEVQANYTLITYKITFKVLEEVIDIVDFNVEIATIEEPAVPTKYGYNGVWGPYNLQLAQNQEVQAIYTLITYTIKFKVLEEVIDTVEFNVEMESITEPAVPLKEGYDGGWGTYNLQLAQNQEVQAIYTLITYTIKFKVLEEVIDTVEFNVEMESIVEPAVPLKTGYTGVWGTYNLQLAQNQEVQAIYTLITYKITFKVLEEVIDAVDFNIKMESITEPAVPLKEGYDGAWGTYNLQLAQNQEVQAIYTPKTYTVTWKNWNGDVLEIDLNVPYDTMPEYNGSAPTKYGYDFTNWYPTISKVKGDAEYVAQFNIATYTITFKVGDLVIDVVEFNIEMASIVEPAVPLKEGYNGEWGTYNLQLAQNQEVQAIYTAQTFTITWKNWNETVLETDLNVPYDTPPLYDGATPTKSGYVFAGWTPALSKVTGDETYTATFKTPLPSMENFVYVDNGEGYTVVNYIGTSVTVTIPAEYNGKPVTMIDKAAFYNNEYISDVTIPDSVISIGSEAFYQCWNLNSVTFGSGIKSIGANAFVDCFGLSSISLPDGLTYLGESIFVNCFGIATLSLPNSIEGFGSSMFDLTDPYMFSSFTYNEYANGNYLGNETNPYLVFVGMIDDAATSITIHDNCKLIADYAFIDNGILETVDFGTGLQIIGEGAFHNCSALTSITIPNSVIKISDSAFQYSSVTEVTLGDNVKHIGAWVFDSCWSLTTVLLPNSLEYVGPAAFDFWGPLTKTEYDNGYYLGNSSNPYLLLLEKTDVAITNITIHENTKLIGTSAFMWCDNLTTITIPKNVKFIGQNPFIGCINLTEIIVDVENAVYKAPNNTAIIEKATNKLVLGLKNTIIPEGVTSIGDYAFENRDGLTTIVIPDGVTSIGEYAFAYCQDLESVTIPNSVTKIGANAFVDCGQLTSIALPTNLKVIEPSTFERCYSLKYIIIPNSVSYIDSVAFSDCSGMEHLILGAGVLAIGESAFQWCTKLTEIKIPDNVKSINFGAFSWCKLVTSITIGSGVVHMYNPGFASCINATSLKVDANNTTYYTNLGSYNVIVKKSGNRLISGIKTSILPANIHYIEDYAFFGCSGLENIDLGSNVWEIGSYAFYRCTSLSMIIIPDSADYIGEYAFDSCENLSIYAEKTSEYLAWEPTWNASNRPIYWYSETPNYDGSHWRYVDGVPVIWTP